MQTPFTYRQIILCQGVSSSNALRTQTLSHPCCTETRNGHWARCLMLLVRFLINYVFFKLFHWISFKMSFYLIRFCLADSMMSWENRQLSVSVKLVTRPCWQCCGQLFFFDHRRIELYLCLYAIIFLSWLHSLQFNFINKLCNNSKIFPELLPRYELLWILIHWFAWLSF